MPIQTMPVRIFWDDVVSWPLTGFVVLHDRADQPLRYARHMLKLQKMSKLKRAFRAFTELSDRAFRQSFQTRYFMDEAFRHATS